MDGIMEIMDSTGHTKHEWDSTKPAEVAAARKVFDELIAKGFRAFRDDDQTGLMTKFDPSAGRMVMVERLAGG